MQSELVSISQSKEIIDGVKNMVLPSGAKQVRLTGNIRLNPKRPTRFSRKMFELVLMVMFTDEI